LSKAGKGTGLLLLALCLLFLLSNFEAGVYTTPDAYLYYGLARSVSENGEYARFDRDGDAREITVPPLYPLLLGLVGCLTGGSVLALNAVGPLLFTAAMLLLARRFGRLGWGPTAPLLGAVLVLGNHTLVHSAWGTMSDVPFLAAIGFAAALLPTDRDASPRRWLLAGLLVGTILFGTRIVGIGFLGAIGVTLLLRRRLAAAITFGLGAAAPVLAWVLWVRSAGAPSGYSHAMAFSGVGDFLGNLLGKLPWALTDLGKMILPQADRVLPWAGLWMAVGGLMLGSVLLWLVLRRPRSWLLLLVAILAGLGMALVTRFYTHQRYLYPVFLLTAFCLVRMLVDFRGRRVPGLAMAVALVVVNLAVTGLGAARSLPRQIGVWSEPAVSARRVVASGAAEHEKQSVLGMLELAERMRGERDPLVFATSGFESYAGILLPGKTAPALPYPEEAVRTRLREQARERPVWVIFHRRPDRRLDSYRPLLQDGALRPVPLKAFGAFTPAKWVEGEEESR
jgi:4-amino-4-deoxy-L-arabinose transferase-like glycosyltransferase